MRERRKLSVNLIASVICFALNICYGLLLTPYIVHTIGTEANGYLGLANNMVNYASILTVALNSVVGRFVSIKYHENKHDEANSYFVSTIIANIFLATILLFIAFPILVYLEKIINIESCDIRDVKILFLFVILNFIINVIFSSFSVSTFITNKLYLTSIANVVAIFIKGYVLIILFSKSSIHLWYVGFATCLSSFAYALFHICYKRKLIPDIVFNVSLFSLKKIKELLAAGVWNSITRLAQMLSDGLDLLLANLFVSPYKMGLLSISQTVPVALSSLMSTISSLFTPNITLYYAKNDKEMLMKELKNSIFFTGSISNAVFATVVIVGKEFYMLWQPGQNYDELYILTLLYMLGFLTSGVATSLQSIPLITNNLKKYSLVWLLVSFFNMLNVYFLLHTKLDGACVIASVSQIMGCIVNLTFVPIYSAYLLKEKMTYFYSAVFRYLTSTVLMIFILKFISFIYVFEAHSWITLITKSAVYIVLEEMINWIFMLEKEQKNMLITKLIKKG